jgi:hypothetical protein
MKQRYRVTLDLTIDSLTPLSAIHAMLTNKLTDDTVVSGLTIVDAFEIVTHLNVPSKVRSR